MHQKQTRPEESWDIQYLGTDKGWRFGRTDGTPRVVYQLLGTAHYRVGRTGIALNSGDVLVTQAALSGRGDHPFVEVKIPRAIFAEATEPQERRRMARVVPVGKRNVPILETILIKLLREREQNLPLRQRVAKAYMIELLVLIGRIESGALPPWQQHESLSVLLSHHRVQGTVSYASEHCHEHLTLQQLAHMAGVNRTTFCKLHKSLTGLTPMKLITTARIEKAKALLRSSTLSLPSISEAVGFANPPAFFTAFRRETGMTPLAYRCNTERTVRSGGGTGQE